MRGFLFALAVDCIVFCKKAVIFCAFVEAGVFDILRKKWGCERCYFFIARRLRSYCEKTRKLSVI